MWKWVINTTLSYWPRATPCYVLLEDAPYKFSVQPRLQMLNAQTEIDILFCHADIYNWKASLFWKMADIFTGTVVKKKKEKDIYNKSHMMLIGDHSYDRSCFPGERGVHPEACCWPTPLCIQLWVWNALHDKVRKVFLGGKGPHCLKRTTCTWIKVRWASERTVLNVCEASFKTFPQHRLACIARCKAYWYRVCV